MVKKKNHEELEQYDEWDEDYIVETSSEYILAIGTFVLAFSSLEHSVNLALAEEINDRGHLPGYQIIELLTARDKIDLLTRMMGAHLYHTESNKQKEFTELMSAIKSMNTFRNKILHANWMTARADGTVRTRIVIDEEEGNVLFERTKITPEIIHAKSNECTELDEKLDDFWN